MLLTVIRLLVIVSGFMTTHLAAVSITADQVPILPCAINRGDQRKGPVAICAMFRDEADYLVEWIEYHRIVGVSHFFLYNNYSHDHFWEVLKPYVDRGIVELFDVPFDSNEYNDFAATHNFVQVCCYNHAISLSRNYNTWLAIIDADEFVCPVTETNLEKALSRYLFAGGLVVYWQLYGTSNVWELAPGEAMIEKLLYKAPNPSDGLFKSIVRPEFAYCKDPHYSPMINSSILMVNPTGGSFSHTPGFTELPVDHIRINHYTYRTESYYENVKKPRRARWGYIPSADDERVKIDHCNSVYDPVMLRFVSQLKKKLRSIQKK